MAKQTRTVWFKWQVVVDEIHRFERLGWAVKFVVPTKKVVGSTVLDGFLVVFAEVE